jgi:hypothetical protein
VVQTGAVTAGYPGTPLPRKLGVVAGARVLLASAPAGFDLGPLPEGVIIHRGRGSGGYDVVVLFCRDVRTLTTRFAPLVEVLPAAGALWACWPKQAGGVPTDLTETTVRGHGLAVGLVDVKVAAVDEAWSGLKFVRRVRDR